MSVPEKPRAPEPTVFTARAHPNIALVKYWGKRASTNNVPAVGSVSLTLDTLESIAHVRRLAVGTPDSFELDGQPATGQAAAKLSRFAARLRALAVERNKPPLGIALRAHNNFPTAAGLASSASGFAALTLALNAALSLEGGDEELACWARWGSGSAPRSLYGGFVRLAVGTRDDGSDVAVTQLAPAAHWPLRVVVAITSRAAKATGSTEGMGHTRNTSPFFDAFVAAQPQDIAKMGAAILARDFVTLAQVTQHSCMKMHAVALAADPPLLYWSPATLAALLEVLALAQAGVPVAPTIDAGPQLKAVCPADVSAQVAARLRAVPGVIEVLDVGLGAAAKVTAEST